SGCTWARWPGRRDRSASRSPRTPPTMPSRCSRLRRACTRTCPWRWGPAWRSARSVSRRSHAAGGGAPRTRAIRTREIPADWPARFSHAQVRPIRSRGPESRAEKGPRMGAHFPVVLVDDGELDEVREILLDLGVEFAHLRGGAVPSRLEP